MGAKFICVMLKVGSLALNKHSVDRKVYLEMGWTMPVTLTGIVNDIGYIQNHKLKSLQHLYLNTMQVSK